MVGGETGTMDSISRSIYNRIFHLGNLSEMGKLTEVYIFSQPIRSGKTSTLLEWTQSQTQGSVAGILAPDIDNQRWLLDISTSESAYYLQMQTKIHSQKL